MDRFQRRSCCDLSSTLHGSDTADSDGSWSHEQRNTKQERQGSERWWQTKQSNTASMSKKRKHGRHFSKLPSLRQDVPKNVEESVTWRALVDLLDQRSPRQREAARRARAARVQVQSTHVGNVARRGTSLPTSPRRRSMRWMICLQQAKSAPKTPPWLV